MIPLNRCRRIVCFCSTVSFLSDTRYMKFCRYRRAAKSENNPKVASWATIKVMHVKRKEYNETADKTLFLNNARYWLLISGAKKDALT